MKAKFDKFYVIIVAVCALSFFMINVSSGMLKHPENEKTLIAENPISDCHLDDFDYSDSIFLKDFKECLSLVYGYKLTYSDKITFFLDQGVGLQGTPSLIKAEYGKRFNVLRELKSDEGIVVVQDDFEIYFFDSDENLNFANSQLMNWESLNAVFIPLKFFDLERKVLLLGSNKDPLVLSKKIKDLIEN
ncbi:hypothetical protein CL645_01520 [bacterium]|nr:hypothetical protein [bacterium]